MARSRLSTVNFGIAKTGLSTVGYTLYNPSGTVSKARTTSGVGEFGTGTGVYGATITLPDTPVLVLWDTGEGSPRYGSEDNNTQLDSIQEGTDLIRLIWNSLKNQGSFFSAIMERLGLLEKNKGVVKQDIVDVVNGIKFPKSPEIKIPEIKDYSAAIAEISKSVSALSAELSSNKSAVVKVSTGKVEQMLSSLSSKIDALPKYESQFQNVQQMIQSTIKEAAASIKSDSSSSSAEMRAKSDAVMAELKKLQAIFSRFDSLMGRINDFNLKLKEIDVNDKNLIKAKDAIHAEIIRMNTLVNTLAIINKVSGQRERDNSLVMAFGVNK